MTSIEAGKDCPECVIADTAGLDSIGNDVKKCVTCPFCKQVVTAILTKNAISCPNCKASAKL